MPDFFPLQTEDSAEFLPQNFQERSDREFAFTGRNVSKWKFLRWPVHAVFHVDMNDVFFSAAQVANGSSPPFLQV